MWLSGRGAGQAGHVDPQHDAVSQRAGGSGTRGQGQQTDLGREAGPQNGGQATGECCLCHLDVEWVCKYIFIIHIHVIMHVYIIFI